MTEDKRPGPRPRKYPMLWQSYLLWEELMKMRQRHTLRLSSIEKGKSNLDATFERAIMEGKVTMVDAKGKVKHYEMFNADKVLREAEKIMIGYGQQHPAWDWMTGIKGLGAGGQAAKVLALIDDIERYETIAKLWRYSGYGLYRYYTKDGKAQAPFDGKKYKKYDDGTKVAFHVSPTPKSNWDDATMIDRGVEGWVLPYNKTLKSALFIVADCFIRQQTPHYTDIYYAEKRRQRELHPEKITRNGKTMFSDGHIDARGKRKMIKEFLKDLWIEWRTIEGLPLTKEWEPA